METVKEEAVGVSEMSVVEGTNVAVTEAIKEGAVETVEVDSAETDVHATEGDVMKSFALFEVVGVGWEGGIAVSLRIGR